MDISNYNVAEAEHTKLVEEKDKLIKERNKEGRYKDHTTGPEGC